MPKNLIDKINNDYNSFSKGQKLIADFIVTHYDKAAFMTAAKLADRVGVSESTVVRFAAELGYDGYPELLRILQELVRTRLTAVQRIEVASSMYDEKEVLETVINADIEKLKKTLVSVDRAVFKEAVQTILNANKIYILGVRSSASLASFLGFYFNLMFDNVRLVHTTSVSEMFEQILRADNNDVVIGISFPRYSRRTIKALQYAKSKGSKVIAITDRDTSPLALSSDYVLAASSDMVSFVDSLVAPLSLINALIIALGMEKKQDVYNTFQKLEHIWEEYQVYESTDSDSE